jgi:hypothetical protein
MQPLNHINCTGVTQHGAHAPGLEIFSLQLCQEISLCTTLNHINCTGVTQNSMDKLRRVGSDILAISQTLCLHYLSFELGNLLKIVHCWSGRLAIIF